MQAERLLSGWATTPLTKDLSYTPNASAPQRERELAHNGRMIRRALVAVTHLAVLAVVLVALVAWWWLRDSAVDEPTAEVASAQADGADAPGGAPASKRDSPSTSADGPPPAGATAANDGAAAPVALPLLDESDAFVRAWLQTNAPLVWTAWRVREDLVRLAAVLLDYAARGQVPRRSLSFVAVSRFEAREEGARNFIHPRSYARYDALVETTLALPAEDAAALFTLLEPLLAEAVRELDASAPAPRVLLQRAVDHVLATPLLTEPVALTRPAVYYAFADPTLEALAPLQKQLLRTGAANVASVQAYARRLRGALNSR